MKEKWNILLLFISTIMSFVSLFLWIIIPEELTLNLSASIFTVTTWIILFLLNKKIIIIYVKSSFFKNFSNSIISLFLLFVILGFINYLSFKHPVLWTLSKQSNQSISKRSQKVLQSIKGKLEFIVFSNKENHQTFDRVFQQFRFYKNDINFSFVNPQLRPDLVKKYNILDGNTIVVKFKGKLEYVRKFINELSVINAILKVTRKRAPLIYYSVGHGELDLMSQKETGGRGLAKLIYSSTYRIHKIDLRQISIIPKTVKCLILWGPKNSLLKNEIEVIRNFLLRGGRLLVAIDPQLNGDTFLEFRNLMKEFKVNIHNNLVIDRLKSANGSNGMAPIVNSFSLKHPITSIFNRVSVLFPVASSVSKITQNDSHLISANLAMTTVFPGSWGETSFKQLGKGIVQFNSKKDIQGPLSIVMSFKEKINNIGNIRKGQLVTDERRIVVFGNSTFISNRFSKIRDNFSLFLNSLSWLADEERLISLGIPNVAEKPIFISKPGLALIFSLSVFLFPILFIFLSFYFYRSRKKL